VVQHVNQFRIDANSNRLIWQAIDEGQAGLFSARYIVIVTADNEAFLIVNTSVRRSSALSDRSSIASGYGTILNRRLLRRPWIIESRSFKPLLLR
jgi:hypothetical protein